MIFSNILDWRPVIHIEPLDTGRLEQWELASWQTASSHVEVDIYLLFTARLQFVHIYSIGMTMVRYLQLLDLPALPFRSFHGDRALCRIYIGIRVRLTSSSGT